MEGFTLSLNNYKEIDGLKVKIYVKYEIKVNRYWTWQMTHPSNRLMLIFNYPPELELSIESFGITPGDLEEESKNGFHSVKYDSWLLPGNGFAFQFRNKKTAQPTTHLLNPNTMRRG